MTKELTKDLLEQCCIEYASIIAKNCNTKEFCDLNINERKVLKEALTKVIEVYNDGSTEQPI